MPVTRSDASSKNHGEMVCASAESEQQYIADCYRQELAAPHWLIWRYSAPAIVLGRSQQPDPGQLARAAGKKLPLIRRRSGGGAVMAGPEMLSLSVFLPAQHAIARGGPVAAYHWLGQLWRDVLGQVGVNSRLCELDEARRSQQQAREVGADWACYSSISHGELVTPDGRKLLGIAQIRSRFCTVLTSGVYLRAPAWATLAEVVAGGRGQVEYLADFNASIGCITGTGAKELAGVIPAGIDAALHRHLAD